MRVSTPNSVALALFTLALSAVGTPVPTPAGTDVLDSNLAELQSRSTPSPAAQPQLDAQDKAALAELKSTLKQLQDVSGKQSTKRDFMDDDDPIWHNKRNFMDDDDPIWTGKAHYVDNGNLSKRGGLAGLFKTILNVVEPAVSTLAGSAIEAVTQPSE